MLLLPGLRIRGWGLLLIAGLFGCENRTPEPRHNRNLGGDAMILLPDAVPYPRAHDADVLQGQATLVKRGDPDAAAKAAPPTALPPDQPAESASPEGLGGALGNIGKALLGSLGGSPPPPVRGARPPAPPPAPGAEPTPPSGSPAPAPGAGALAPDDETAIRAVLTEYNAARQKRDFAAASALHIPGRPAESGPLGQVDKDLSAAIDTFADALEKKQPGAKTQVQEVAAKLYPPLAVQQITAAGPDAAVGLDAKGRKIQFQREAGKWRLWPEPPGDAQTVLEQRRVKQVFADWLDVTIDAVVDGKMSPDQALADFTAKLQPLNDQTGG